MGIHISQVLGIAWISALSEIFKKPINLKCLCFSILFPYNGNHFFPCFGNCMDFCFKQKILETLKCVCLLIFFPCYGNSLFPYFGNCMGFSSTQNIWETHYFGMFVFFFPYFSRFMGIHFSHVLGIVWVSASSKIFKKPINLKCLCFPILFPYYGNTLFPCVGNCMDFCFQQKILQTRNFEMFMFSRIFSLLCQFTFLIFWELYVLMPHMKYVRNP